MTRDARGDGPEPRPASPFGLLLLGLATTVVGAEWLRFQSSVIVAAPVAAVGLAATLGGVARAFRARRRWRARRAAADEAARSVPAAQGGDAPEELELRHVRAAPSRRATDAADSPRTGRRRLRWAGSDATHAARSEDGPERTPFGAETAGPADVDADRDLVGAARTDAGRDRRSPRDDG